MFAVLASALTAATSVGPFPATLQRDGTGALVLHWPGETGKRYFLETSTDLATWSWLPDAFAGADLATTVIAAGATPPTRLFWRAAAFDAAVVAPGLSLAPADQTVPNGFSTTFSAEATGAAPLAYQWYRNGVAIVGATGATYTTSSVTTANEGAAFTVTVRNAGGVVASQPAALHVQPTPLPVGLWTFDNPAAPYAALIGKPLTVTGSPGLAAGPGNADGALTLATTDFLTVDHGIAANGGGPNVNRWTVVLDLRVPAIGKMNSLLQTTPANNNNDNSDCFIGTTGGIGSFAAGFSITTLRNNRWYRLALVVDNGARYDIYLDGKNILRGYPGRFALLSRLLVLAGEQNTRLPVDLSAIALFDRALSDAEVAALGDLAPPGGSLLTLPYLQNVKTDGITVMWEADLPAADSIEYGITTAYGTSRIAAGAGTSAGTVVHKAVLTGLQPGTTYHFRVHSGAQVTPDQTFKTAPDTAADFSFAVWGDSQGANSNPTNPNEPTNSFMRHMVETERVDFAVTTGDLAEEGNRAGHVWPYFVERPVRLIGEHVPFYVAWGNHDGGISSLLRSYVDLPSKDRAGQGPGYGSFSFDYAGCHFVCIDHLSATSDVAGWVRQDLQSPAAKSARFIFAFIHMPPWCERAFSGSVWLRTELTPYLEQAGAAILFSGHTHAYERGQLNGVSYITTGGGSWLDTAAPLVYDWPHITVGGYSNVPATINHGLVNEYVKVEVSGQTCTVKMMAFSRDGSFLGVLDTFQVAARLTP
ncbi:MAG: metallophosphoesterase [Opitutaceae bacterium]|nr:metallophosphoesterase [Opitutaceae bacterium]